MTDGTFHTHDHSLLRCTDEKHLRNSEGIESDYSSSRMEMRRIIHELSVHQIERVIQKDELLLSREKLEKSLEYFIELYDFASQGFLTLSSDGTILEANLTATKLLDVERSRLKGSRFEMFVAFEDISVFNAMIDNVFSFRRSGFCEISLYRDHVESAGATSLTPRILRVDALIRNDNQQCLLVLSDITRQKQIEQENARLQDALENFRNMEMVGQLAGGMAHYNKMLDVILGHAESIRKEVDPASSVRSNLEAIQKVATRSAEITGQLLDFACKRVAIPKIIGLDGMAEGIITMLRRLIDESITLVWVPASRNALIKIDPVQIDQIILNLCLNSRDAMVAGGKITMETGRVTVTKEECAHGHCCAAPGEYVKLVVTDDGCGIDTKDLPHIFEPFFTTKLATDGNGLGLSTVYGIVKQSNGSIKCESKPGHGATFTLFFPHHRSSAASIRTVQLNPSVATQGEETILLVDDESEVLELLKEMLEHYGYNVYTANPARAILIAEQHRGGIDLLLTDVMMPEMNGFELAQRIKSVVPDIKVLFMSGYSTDVISDDTIIQDGVNFIQKPFSFKALSVAVRAILNPVSEV
ncbi:ATP-binding protein [Pelodictyon phaeoclathratiforme]|uniref:histidine kinase n=1 Tax=Pelodictyon phaeoclathratiforme (strain DSM 5477 / BU-1) TaxID=324925 RepID=B4SF13_PELPB|nr:ATP-binding protein [Pelodictyon phaeoclathratiforme]ACF43160.1 histidine kinase [Pelodictyon phaeoclathratiforme BU-1]MBV5290601.1 response regulator [Pelodictyon phaeoclathratiforme]